MQLIDLRLMKIKLMMNSMILKKMIFNKILTCKKLKMMKKKIDIFFFQKINKYLLIYLVNHQDILMQIKEKHLYFKHMKIKDFGWEFLKMFYCLMKDQIGVIERVQLNYPKIKYCCL
jgi:hypothetical protein